MAPVVTGAPPLPLTAHLPRRCAALRCALVEQGDGQQPVPPLWLFTPALTPVVKLSKPSVSRDCALKQKKKRVGKLGVCLFNGLPGCTRSLLEVIVLSNLLKSRSDVGEFSSIEVSVQLGSVLDALLE